MNEKLVVDLDAVALWGSLTRGDPPWLPGITDPQHVSPKEGWIAWIEDL